LREASGLLAQKIPSDDSYGVSFARQDQRDALTQLHTVGSKFVLVTPKGFGTTKGTRCDQKRKMEAPGAAPTPSIGIM